MSTTVWAEWLVGIQQWQLQIENSQLQRYAHQSSVYRAQATNV